MERGNSIRRRFDAWERIQVVYMPQAIAKRQADAEAEAADTEMEGNGESSSRAAAGRDTTLLMPSDVVGSLPVARRLVRFEFQFREAQAHTTLRDIRSTLMLQSHMFNSKNKYGHGTAHMTRSNALLTKISTRVARLADKYRAIRARLVKLSDSLRGGSGSSKITDGWENVLQRLAKEDLRGLTHLDSHKLGPGQGHVKLSWLWNVVGKDGEVGTSHSGKSPPIHGTSISH